VTDTVAWRIFVAEAERRLSEAGMASPAVDARRIVERASGHEGSAYLLGLDEPATKRGVHHFDVMLERRLAGEPLQYVVGSWGFRELDLLVDPRVLIPRPETEVVVEMALRELDRLLVDRPVEPGRTRATAVDLGTGSGAIALSLAVERSGVQVWASDASGDALDVARANLAGIGVHGARVRLAQGDWFEALPVELAGGIDLVVSNPPYVAVDDPLPDDVADWEPSSALIGGPRGTEDLEIIIDAAPRWLSDQGVLVVELAPDQAEVMAKRARGAGFVEAEVFVDLTGRQRGVIARRG
jgi:release factor glutamine methyltransferase